MKTDKEFFLSLLMTADDFFCSGSNTIEADDSPVWGLFMGYPLVRLNHKNERYIVHCDPDLTASTIQRFNSTASSSTFTIFLNKCYDQCTNEEIEEIIRFHNL